MRADEIQALFPAGVVVEAGDPAALGGSDAALLPEERALIARAAGRRRQDFVAGRVLARRALARLTGGEAANRPLLKGRRGEPLWPLGIAGSIAHTAGACGVVVARVESCRALGFDVEGDDDLEPGLLRRVCTEAERAWLAEQPAASRGALAKVVFSAKEAVYKCLYPLSGRFLGFHDVSLEIDARAATFAARIAGSDAPAATGRFARASGRVITGATLA